MLSSKRDMQLTKLTLSGFKSFARATVFQFPVAASAIVGPNGSGKSNVAEAIRWVLGEQSLKILRGKKGEDLIFNGSASSPRMGKALVALTFDNRDHAIPLDFDEVALERKIFRDGTNEYYLNGSQVRLKDIVELLARIGLGETKHNIIGQGEVDRILLSSPQDRRSMLEEAIGLRLYQLKKRQAERKLEETEENTVRGMSLLRELAPHLKFLKSQAEKAQKTETLRRDLEEHILAFIDRERREIKTIEVRLREQAQPLEARLASIEHDIDALGEVGEATRESPIKDEPSSERELEKLEQTRREFERDLGRIEGRIEAGAASLQGPRAPDIDEKALKAKIAPLIASLRSSLTENSLEALRDRVRHIADSLEKELLGMTHAPEIGGLSDGAPHLANERERVQGSLEKVNAAMNALKKELAARMAQARATQDQFRARFKALRLLEDERNEIKSSLQRLAFEEERLEVRRKDLEQMVSESNLSHDAIGRGSRSHLAEATPDELKKKIERFRIRLEEIGGIDEAVVKEFQGTRDRYEFLERELADLKTASGDLQGLIDELDQRIEHDFKAGFAKIKAEFHNYFRIIFGGGKGTLSYILVRTRALGNDGETDAGEESDEPEYGIDIDVELPRKRIKGLQMLSGGERALVSIALLFAITAVNPPPFLVLDETDAALDETNSQKYAAILKELSKKTQLIIITHNRETMKQAGVLYGVTMGEDGISKVLSLKLEEAAECGNR